MSRKNQVPVFALYHRGRPLQREQGREVILLVILAVEAFVINFFLIYNFLKTFVPQST